MMLTRFHNILITIFGIVIMFLVIKNHAISFQEKTFYTSFFDVENVLTEKTIGQVKVIKFAHDEIIIEGDWTHQFQSRAYYQFSVEGKTYTFTFEYILLEEENTILRYVVWLHTKPSFYKKEVAITKVQIKQNNLTPKVSIHLISDEFGCCLLEGKRLRYDWRKINSNIGFVGKVNDVYGFAYTPTNEVASVLNEENYPANYQADIHLLWLGRSELNKKVEVLTQEIDSIYLQLKQLQSETKIVLLTPAPSPVPYFDEKITTITKHLKKSYPQEVIDVNQFIKSYPHWEEKLFFEDYGLNEKAYQRLIPFLNEQLF